MKYDLVVFDLDGTLVDSFGFFIGAHNVLAEQHGFRPVGPEEVAGLRHLAPRDILRHVGLPRWRLPWVARDFMRMMEAGGNGIRLFDGIDHVLRCLNVRGVQLAVVSSNSVANCRRRLGPELAGLMACIDGGASIFGKRRRIQRVVRALGVRPSRAIYIGDQLSDADAARAAGVPFGAVHWGYGAPEALEAACPDRTFATVAALTSLAR